ncbi:OmpA family protein [Pedobacter rhizosphaerae]|uniref:WD40-like Beta Propeller Repeat n=1 Tax=Pedobacter rhizosphaerae TaxID=390241 RepID=A0A1H9KNU3_9SPHI|nr:OmpA family protein [Pedobacter rhizosphaerae]SER00762.1 WD40-like Beta Propeller Repeat [Pedobacter rhizosphaerae]
MKKLTIGICLSAYCMLATGLSVKAQYVIKDADKQFELYNYTKAIPLYEEAYKKKASLHAAERLAQAYTQINNYPQSESWYAIATKLPKSGPENVLGYARALQHNAKFSEAKAQYLNYGDLNKGIAPKLLAGWAASCDSAIKWMRNPKQVVINNDKKLNSQQSDWGAVRFGQSIVFTSDRIDSSRQYKNNKGFLWFDGSKEPDKKRYGGSGNAYLKLYVNDLKTDSIHLFPVDAGIDYHVGPASFTADGKTMFFALTRIPDVLAKSKNKTATVNVEIYSSTIDADGKWTEPVSFKYNNVSEYSVADPFVSSDGQSLYFSSNMPGGKGGADIYVSLKTDAGDWGKPTNLSDLNTEGNERTPVFDSKNNLYFSSDGWIGMGGLDIFRALRSGSGIGRVENLGYPINSPKDDFSFSIDAGDGLAYFSSDRDGGLGSDDIYTIDNKIIAVYQLEGTVYNSKTGQAVSGATVTLEKVNGGAVLIETDDNGGYKFNLAKDTEYNVKAQKTAYRVDIENLATIGLTSSEVITQDLHITPIELYKGVRLDNIYYDFDKWDIRKDAALELDNLVKILQENPTIWIELGSHTDSRGKDSYNLTLSQKRAEAAVEYLISKGIERSRLEARGYGETVPLNKCKNGVECSDAEHQLNRRTEFKITKM